MKKKKVLGNIFLSIILCLPLLGFRYSDETVSTETISTSELKTKMTDSLSSTTSTTVEEMTESSSSATSSTNSESLETTTENSESTGETSLTEEEQEPQRSTITTESVGEKFFVSITDKDYVLLKEPDGERVNDNNKNYQKTFSAQKINGNSETTYFLLSTSTTKLGYIAASSVEKVAGEEGKLFPEATNTYGSIVSPNAILFTSDFKEKGMTSQLLNQTFRIEGSYHHYDGKTYYLLKDSNDQTVGIVTAAAVEKGQHPAGKKHLVNDYYSVIKKDQKVWKNINLEEMGTTTAINEKTFNVKEWYYHFDGSKYFALYDINEGFKGIVKESTIQKASNQGGIWHSTNQYVTINRNNWTIWQDLGFNKGNSTKDLYQRTYRVTGYYNHLNGTKYLSVYDGNDNWQGYLNKDGAEAADGPGGKWYGTNQYITVTKNNWTIWSDFNFNKGKSTKNLYQRTYRVTGWYRHYNGTKYLSVYDNKGNWQGYLNEGGAQVVNNPGGKWNSTNQYITVTKNNWTIWNDFNFKKGNSTKNMYTKTYRVTGWYRHYNGTKYLSLYDSSGNWQGYLNEGGAAKANGAQGTGFAMNKSVLVIKSGYSIWNNFNWKEKTRTNSVINKTYQVKWYYKHMNGSTYYSLYDSNGKWFGYVNSGAVRERRGVAHYLGTTRQRVVNELNAHQNDRFYLGTPFRLTGFNNPEMFLVPNGIASPYGPGMNCTGFVACVTRRSGGNLSRISGITQGYGGYVNAYNWRDALTRNTEYYSFSSIDALLRSGKAQKGDLIYLEAVFTDPSYDCHIGIFWGNRSNENRFWHQVIDGNKISHIYSGTPYSKVYLFPQD